MVGNVIFSNGDDEVIVIEDASVSVGGTVEIYSDILIKGDSKIIAEKCISSYNNSKIRIDLTTRSRDEAEVLRYNCSNIPFLDVELEGTFSDGCVPRYQVRETSLVLLFDTPSCQDNSLVLVIVICAICGACLIIAVILIILLSNKNIRRRIFINRTKDTAIPMTDIEDKMKLVDDEIESTNKRVKRLHTILDQ